MLNRPSIARAGLWRAIPLQGAIAWSAAAHVLLLLFLVLLANPVMGRQAELDLYYTYYFRMYEGLVPYRDFLLEYPPLCPPILLLPRLFFPVGWLTLENYTAGFWIITTAASFATSVYAIKLGNIVFGGLAQRQRLWLMRLVIFGVLLIAYIPFRYDIFPTLCVMAALYYIAADKPLAAGVWIAVGTLAKLYPVLLVPFLVAYYLLNRKGKASRRLLFGTIGGTIIGLIPFALIVGPGLITFLTYHTERGVEIESLYSTVILLGWLAGLVGASTHHDHGSFNTVAAWAGPLGQMMLPLLVIAEAAIFILYIARSLPAWRHGQNPRLATLLPALFAALLVFILTNKVFSPQYLIWLLPLAILARPRVVWSYGVALVFTAIITLFFIGLIRMETLMILVLAARNLVLIDTLFASLNLTRRDLVLLRGLPSGLRAFLWSKRAVARAKLV